MTLRGGEKILLPFPKGWSRVVAAQRHLNEGTAGKTTLHQLDARREASIRRSQCGNSEAIVGGWVGTSTNNASEISHIHLSNRILITAQLFYRQSKPKISTLEGEQQRHSPHSHCSGWRGVTPQRHLSKSA